MKTENAIALGTFDGVHLGHRAVLSIPDKYNKVAVTFYVPPKYYFSGNTELIFYSWEKAASLMKLGFDEIAMDDFSKYREMSANEFLQYLYNEFKPSLISCGFNYRFGKGGQGDSKLLETFCKEKGIVFNCVGAVEHLGTAVSSTAIRELLKNGQIEKANELTFKPFYIEEEVIKGDMRGRTLGFPTINQKYPEDKVKIKSGVYKTNVIIKHDVYSGITYIGNRPSFETDYIISETYIKGFNGDLYGETVGIEFIKFLRNEVKFDSAEKLKEQLNKDINAL